MSLADKQVSLASSAVTPKTSTIGDVGIQEEGDENGDEPGIDLMLILQIIIVIIIIIALIALVMHLRKK